MEVCFYRYETESLQMQIVPYDALAGYSDVVVSFKQAGKRAQLDIDTADLVISEDTGTITVNLSQEQTALFAAGEILVQVNILFEDSERDATAQAKIGVLDNLYEQVMT